MRVLLSSTRGAGHLQPLIPYAHALLRHGHDVLVASPESTAAALHEAKLAHAPFDHPGDALLSPIWARLRGVTPDDALGIVMREIFAGLNARTALPKLRETIRSWRPNVVLRESAEFGAAIAAEAAGVRHARVCVHMVAFEEVHMTAAAGAALDPLRDEVGLPRDGGASLRAEAAFSAFPASLDETDVPVFRAQSQSQLRGDVDVSTLPSWARGDAAHPLVYVTFGTIAGGTPEARVVYRAALDAVADMNVRVLLTTGPGLDAGGLGAVPANVTVEAWVPQAAALPHVAAMVCHGGSGTLLGGLAAGVPMVIAPLNADQPHNARRVDDVGAGIAVLKPDASSLRVALERVLVDAEIHSAARRVAQEIANMPTVDDAVASLVGV